MPGESNTQEVTAGRFKVGDWWVDPQLDELMRGGEVLKLEPRMIRLLAKLAEHPGQVLSTQQLLDSVWSGVVVGPASVYQAVSSLRKILGDTDPVPTYIATVPRRGYRLVAPVELTSPRTGAGATAAATTPRRSRWIWAGAGLVIVLVAALLAGLPRRDAGIPQPDTSTTAATRDRPSLAIAAFEAAGTDDDSRLVASAMRELLHNRLITQDGLVLLSTASTEVLKTPNADLRELCRRMNARFLLQGRVLRAVDLLRVELTLLEPAAGRTVWSQTFHRSPTGITDLREQIIAAIGEQLRVQIGPKGQVPIDFDAYKMLMIGMEQMAPNTDDAYRVSQPVFLRTTVMHPDFARAYLFVGHALMLRTAPEAEVATRWKAAEKAYRRATEIDPSLGEAWIGIAETTEDRSAAEDLFRKGIALSPNYDLGYFKYGLYLFGAGRPGEAISQIQTARRLDPMSVMPTISQARIAAHTRGDVAQHDRLMRELLELHPKFSMPYYELAASRYFWGGAPAEAAHVLVKLRALDRNAKLASLATAIYLDLGDVPAATAIGNGDMTAMAQIAQFRRERVPLDSFTAEDFAAVAFDPMGYVVAEALRDQAVSTGEYRAALERIEAMSAASNAPPWMARKYLIVRAHAEVLSGAGVQGRERASSMLKLLENETVGRPPHWFARDLASAYAILGDYDRALVALAESQKRNDFTRWWYTAELDPLFAPLRKDPRFLALAEAAKRHGAQQRALLDEMRRKGEIPGGAS